MKHVLVPSGIGLVAAAYLGTIVAQPSADDDEPIELFAKLMPVITHARCMGCHGAVNPFDGGTHPGGVIDADFDWRSHDMNDSSENRECLECHSAGTTESRIGDYVMRSGKWRIAPRHVAFVGKDTKALCKQFAHHARLRSHLRGDELIGLAFVGRRGDATDTADPPPMDRNQFVTAADEWLDKGFGSCGGWEGEITQKETFGSNYEYPMLGDGRGTTQVTETAGREIRIKRENGVTTGTFTMSGHQTIVQKMFLDGCSAVNTSVGEWISTTPADSHVGFRVRVNDDGGYTIFFKGPKETTKSSSQGHMVNDCGLPVFADPEEPPIELEWQSWTFTIRCPSEHAICQIFDPDNRRLSGTMERVIQDHSDAHEPQSRLTVSLAGISRADDGASLPVTVTTSWDLTLTD